MLSHQTHSHEQRYRNFLSSGRGVSLEIQSYLQILGPHVINFPSFRKRHIHNNTTNKESNDPAYLEFYIYDGRIELLHKKKSLISYKSNQYKRIQFEDMNNEVSSYGPVMGLTCIYGSQLRRPIAICNPCLGQLKLLHRFQSLTITAQLSSARLKLVFKERT